MRKLKIQCFFVFFSVPVLLIKTPEMTWTKKTNQFILLIDDQRKRIVGNIQQQ